MDQLRKQLLRIDGKSYKAYKDIQGRYLGKWFELYIDYVQGDPFASPSRIRMVIPQHTAKFPPAWFGESWRKIALEDFLTREVAAGIRKQERNQNGSGGSGKSGMIFIDTPGQEMLPRTSIEVDQDKVDIRLSVGLPAAGRTILGKQAVSLLCEKIPMIIEQAIFHFSRHRLEKHLQLSDQQQAVREYIKKHNLIAFVANGAILPRESGVSNRPLIGSSVIPFQSPPSLEVQIPVPHRSPIVGMGIPAGITLIVGGGYHGKTTLLKAIERGVYNHIPGDGREYVITNETAFKVRAEDGRRVEKVDISPFISNLPFDKDTTRFSTEDASGSTSQAANIMEAIEMGAEVLLIDEDTSATNFMIRDARMQKLVSKGKEPITPFIDQVRPLYLEHGISTILVIGGSGDYFDVADTVLMMDQYRPSNVTREAKEIAQQFQSGRREERGTGFGRAVSRVVLTESFDASKGSREKVDSKGLTTIIYGNHAIDLSFVEQLVDPSQTRAIAHMMTLLSKKFADGKTALPELIDQLYQFVEKKGIDAVSPFYGSHPGDLAMPRKLELAAAINRLRTLKIK